MIDFQNKNMFFSFIAVLIPIIIHFLIRKKSKQIAFPSIFFLKDTIKKKYKKIKFHQLLLLILRICIIFFICLSFVEPTIKAPGFFTSNLTNPGNYVLIIDTSLSMKVKSDKSTIFHEMKNKMLDFIETLPYGSKITVYKTSNNGEILNQPFSLYSNKLINDLTLLLECGYDNSNLLKIYKRAENLLSKTNTRENSIIIFSDFQMNETDELKMYLSNNIKYHTIFIFPDNEKRNSLNNLYFKRSNIPFISYLNRDEIPVEIEISGNSKNPLHGMYSIIINENIKHEESFTAKEENSFIKTFLTERNEKNTTLIDCRINGDDFIDDNSHFITFKGPPLINILSFQLNESSNSNYISKALNPFQEININNKTPFILSKTSSLKDKNELSTYDVIIIPDPMMLNDEEMINIKEFIHNGKTAIISFDKLELIDQYNKLLFTPHDKGKSLLPARIEKIVLSPEEKGFQVTLSEEGKKYFHAISEDKHWKYCFSQKTLNFKSHPNNSRIILQTENNTPLCILNSYGNGQIIFFMTSLKPKTLTLLSEPVFIPFIHKLVDFITQKSRNKISVEVGSKYILSTYNKDNSVIVSPSGKRIIPFKDELNNSYIIPDVPGYYKIIKNKSNTYIDSFAANPPYRESILKYLHIEDFKTLKNNNIFITKNINEASSFINKQKDSLALWRILFWLLILLLITEIIIINKLKS